MILTRLSAFACREGEGSVLTRPVPEGGIKAARLIYEMVR